MVDDHLRHRGRRSPQAAPANPSGLDAEYSLVDTLDFGGDINLISARGRARPRARSPSRQQRRRSRHLHAHRRRATHTYTVTVGSRSPLPPSPARPRTCDSRARWWRRFPEHRAASRRRPGCRPSRHAPSRSSRRSRRLRPSARDAGRRARATGLSATHHGDLPRPALSPRCPTLGYVLTDAPVAAGGRRSWSADWTATAGGEHAGARRPDVGRHRYVDDHDSRIQPGG